MMKIRLSRPLCSIETITCWFRLAIILTFFAVIFLTGCNTPEGNAADFRKRSESICADPNIGNAEVVTKFIVEIVKIDQSLYQILLTIVLGTVFGGVLMSSLKKDEGASKVSFPWYVITLYVLSVTLFIGFVYCLKTKHLARRDFCNKWIAIKLPQKALTKDQEVSLQKDFSRDYYSFTSPGDKAFKCDPNLMPSSWPAKYSQRNWFDLFIVHLFVLLSLICFILACVFRHNQVSRIVGCASTVGSKIETTAPIQTFQENNKKMDESIRKELHEHAWNYFVLHAEQRLKTFHFYLILATLVAGAAVTLVGNKTNLHAVGVFVLLLPFLSFIFWKLDRRNKQLIKHGEEAIKTIESESGISDEGEEPHRLKLFLHEAYITGKRKRLLHTYPWSAHFSYSTCFNAVFLVFGIAGLVAGILLIL